MKKYLTLLLLVSVLTTVNAQEKEFSLKGMIGGLQNEKLFLYQETGEEVILLDSTMTNNGEFSFTGKADHAFVAQLRFAKYKRAKLFLSPSQMNLLVHKDKFERKILIGKLTGSEAQDRYEDYLEKQEINTQKKLKIVDALELPEVLADTIKKKTLLDDYKKLNKFKQKYFYQYASSPVVPYLIYQDYFGAKTSLEDLKKYLEILNKANPNGIYVKNLNKRVAVLDGISERGEVPNINGTTLTGESFSLKKSKQNLHLFYIWRAWTPDKNDRHYKALEEIQSKLENKRIDLVSIIRNSSYNMVRIPGTNKGELWHPTLNDNQKYIQIESIDKSVDFVKYLDRNINILLVDRNGKILYHQKNFDTKLLLSEITKQLSKL